ncbi:MAG: hypothetical protein R3D30_02480 [Hyphomicrobiales bacterium]
MDRWKRVENPWLQPLKYEEGGCPGLARRRASARGRRWVERLDPARALVATAISQAHGVPGALVAFSARGADPQTVARYLDPSLRTLLPDPSRLQDMERAAERFAAAVTADEAVAVFGDYDVDGAASVALIERFLRVHGRSCASYIPDRLTEGYGPTPEALTSLVEEGASLILSRWIAARRPRAQSLPRIPPAPRSSSSITIKLTKHCRPPTR